jgi:hypothetical protein
MGAETAAGTARANATKPVPQAALKAVADTLRDAGTDPSSPEASGGEVSFLRARTANEVLKAQTAKVRLEKMKAEVIDRARATAMVFDLARRERDAWLNWPPRVAANMAAELGVDAHRMEQVLDTYLRAHLAEMAAGWEGMKTTALTALDGAVTGVFSFGDRSVAVFQGAFDAMKAIWGRLPWGHWRLRVSGG